MAKPEPRIVSEVCSLCGLDWNLHAKNPIAEGCVKLLLDEVASLNARIAHRPVVINNPLYPRPYWPTWYSTWGNTAQVSSGTSGINFANNTSTAALPKPQPVKVN